METIKRYSKGLVALLAFVILLITPSAALAISDEEFSANEQYYKDLCFGIINTESQKTCNDFQGYLDRKVASQKSDVASLQLDINEIQANITKYVAEIQGMEKQIETMEAEIVANEQEVLRMQQNIELLQEQIAKRQEEIDILDTSIKNRMVSMQSNLHTNNSIAFLFGAKDFSDFIRRSSVLNTVTTFDQDQIAKVTELREQLKQEQDEVARQQQLLKETIANLEVQKQNVEITKKNRELIVTEFKKQEAELLEKQMAIQGAIKVAESERSKVKQGIADLQRRIEEERRRLEEERRRLEEERRKAAEAGQNPEDLPPITNVGVGDGWIYPVAGRFRVSAGSWYYPASFGGGIHYGVDLAGSVGTPIVATGPGVVIVGYNGCPTYGYLGSTCGYRNNWGGNQVIAVVSMPDGLYALTYSHLQKANVTSGSVITKGTVIGALGSSGNSTGPHLHHEVMYLGNYELSHYLNNIWNGSINFTPNGAWMNLSWACSNKGAPCRVNPQQHYGMSVGGSY